MHDIELLQYIHKTAVMGVVGLEDVAPRIRDEELKKAVSGQIKEYRELSRTSSELLKEHGETPNDPGTMAKMSSEVMTAVETMMDDSASKIAEMVIRGNTMGITKSIKHLNDYSGDDLKVKRLAERLIATEEANVEQMKSFL